MLPRLILVLPLPRSHAGYVLHACGACLNLLPNQLLSACLQDLALLTMPQPEGNLQPGVEENIPGVIPVTNTITRHGGMMHPAKRDKRRIVVDMREFMSPLPCVLHQQTMDVVPVTLEVPFCRGA